MIKAIDLFAGCGGLSLGFQNAGINVCAAFEFWDIAANCYEKNFSHPVFRIDLSDVETSVKVIAPFKPDLIIGGPPCQDFSHAGKRVEAERANLTESFSRIISRIRPRYFVMENVDRAEKSNAFAKAREQFKDAGYGITQIVLDASLCGVPQKRKRFFCIGILNGEDDALLDIFSNRISKKETTLRDYFGDSLGFEYYYRHPRNYSRRAVFSIDEPAPTMRGVNRPVPKGYPGHPNDACPVYEGLHALTTSERALIQTFPSSFQWEGSKTDIEQMIGNAVPVKLAEFVAKTLLIYVNQNRISSSVVDTDQFQSWLVNVEGLSERSSRDVVSRCKRANNILPASNIADAYYFYLLDQQPEFKCLSATVRSQIKRAVQLQNKFADICSNSDGI